MEIIIAGFGGQGIMLTGYILGKAAAIYEGKEALFHESYGPEARGSSCKAGVIISDERIDYPIVENADVLVVLSRGGYASNADLLREGSYILYDTSLVPGVRWDRAYGINATEIAEELQNRIVANIVILGFFTSVCDVLKKESVKKAIESTVSKKFLDLNLRAFEEGYRRGLQIDRL